MEKEIEAIAKSSSSSCLLGDSQILLANGCWKEIRHLTSSDVIVDRYLSPQKVITVNFSYLGNRSLYSFNGEKKPLFTPEHQFFTSLHPDASTSVVSLKLLYEENPQMRGANVEAMIPTGTTVLKLDYTTGKIQQTKVSVEEHTGYNKETKVYFLLVTGDGSYIADGYASKHELPDFTKRPLTNACMAKVMQMYVKLDNKFPVSFTSYTKIVEYHVKKIKMLWEFMIEMDVNLEG